MRSRSLLALAALFIAAATCALGSTLGGVVMLLGGGLRPAVYTDFTRGVLPSAYYAYTGASLRTITDATGAITYAPNNLLLNSAALSTQGVTVSPAKNYMLSFFGTGSITLSGSAVATLAGTDASNQVFLKILAPTADTLTLTVTGSVTSAVLAAVTYETTPRPGDQVITQAAAYYGPAFDFDPITHAPLGLRIEESRTNIFTYSNTFSNAAWVCSGCTVTQSGVSPDGTTNAWYQVLSANTTLHEIRQTVVVTSVVPTLSVYIKQGGYRYVGLFQGGVSATVFDTQLGTFNTLSGSQTSTMTPVGNGWYRATYTPASISAGPRLFGMGVSNSGSAYVANFLADGTSGVYLFGFQIETGSFPTSYIPTLASSAARAADVVTLTGVAGKTLNATNRSAVIETRNINLATIGGAASYLINFSGATTDIIGRITTPTTSVSLRANNNTITTTVGYGGDYSANTLRTGATWTNSTSSIVSGQGQVASQPYTMNTSATIYVGSRDGTNNAINGYVSKLVIYNTALTASQLQARTRLGASF